MSEEFVPGARVTRRALGDCHAHRRHCIPCSQAGLRIYRSLVVLVEAGERVVVKGGGACQGYLHFLRNILLEIGGFGEPSGAFYRNSEDRSL